MSWLRPFTRDVALEMLSKETKERQIELGVRKSVLKWLENEHREVDQANERMKRKD
jgi:hypothetical protein